MFNKLLGIVSNTFLETIRQPAFLVILFVALLLLTMNNALAMFTLGYTQDTDDNKMLTDLNLSTMLLTGLFLAAFSAAGVISREIENKTVLTVISKPVARWMFVIGKYVGVAGAIMVAMYLCAIVTMLTIRHTVLQYASDPFDQPVLIFGFSAACLAVLVGLVGNFLYRWPFTSTAVGVCLINKQWKLQPIGTDFGDFQLIYAMLLVTLAVLLLTAIAVAASTRLGQVMTLMVCAVSLFVFLLTEYLLAGYRAQNPLAAAALELLPNFQNFWAADALTEENNIPLSYVGTAAAYAGCYIVAALLVAVALFEHRELAGESASSSAPAVVNLLGVLGRISAVAIGVWGLGYTVVRATPTVEAMAMTAGLIAVGAFCWWFWGMFGRGAKWSWYIVLLVVALGMPVRVGLVFVYLPHLASPLLLLDVAVGLLSLLLLTRKNRVHFGL
jgi:ABC-2 type transport system permease protein